MTDNAACTELIQHHHYANERRRSMYRVNPRPPLRQLKTTQHVHSQPQTIITTMKDDPPCTESTPNHHYHNENDTACTESTPYPHCDIERRHIIYRVDPRPPLRQWKTTQHVQSQLQTTITTMKDDAGCVESTQTAITTKKDDTACTESTIDQHYDNERQRSMYLVNTRPPLRQWKTTQHVQSPSQTTITTRKDHTLCTQSTYSIPDHHSDNERRHTRYRVNHKTPLRLWKTTQHVQGQLQNTITTMKDDAACTESTPKHHYDNENDTACTESIQTPIATLKDDTPYTEWIPDHHYDNERRLSMYRVKRRPL